MSEPQRKGNFTLVVFGVAVLLNLIFTLMLLDQVRRTRDEVGELTNELASKQDVAMLRPIPIREILEEHCERCHTERRFAAAWEMNDTEILATIERMRSHPGGEEIPADQVRPIGAALVAFRCTACHDESVISQLVLMPRDDRVRFLRKKVALPNSGFRPDQIGLVIEAFRILSGKSS
jgi:hypothetical protein